MVHLSLHNVVVHIRDENVSSFGRAERYAKSSELTNDLRWAFNARVRN